MMENLIPPIKAGIVSSIRKKKERLEVVIRWCSRHMWSLACPDWGRAALLLATNFYQRSQLLMIWTNKPPPPPPTPPPETGGDRVQLRFHDMFLPTIKGEKGAVRVWKSIRKTRTPRPKNWLEVVGDPIEHDYNYLVSIWSCGLPVPGVDLLLSAVWARPNTVRLLKTRSKERAWHDLRYSLDIVVFSGIHVGQIAAGPIAPAVIYHNLLWLYYSILFLFFFFFIL